MPETIMLPRILLTNDDGIDAPGLKLLEEIAQQFTNEVWVIAPEHDASGSGQSLSLARPVYAYQKGEKRIAVDGTPSDCVALAMAHFMADTPPSLVLSGINPGMNIGDDVNTSGTAGAALTALILGVPAIAISQSRGTKGDTPWETTREVLPKVLAHLLMQGWRKDTCLSLNIPNLPPKDITGFSWARQAQKSIATYAVKRRTNPKHQDYFWITNERKTPVSAPNSDSAILRRGEVAVTALTLDRSIDIYKPSVVFNDVEGQEAEAAQAVNE